MFEFWTENSNLKAQQYLFALLYMYTYISKCKHVLLIFCFWYFHFVSICVCVRVCHFFSLWFHFLIWVLCIFALISFCIQRVYVYFSNDGDDENDDGMRAWLFCVPFRSTLLPYKYKMYLSILCFVQCFHFARQILLKCIYFYTKYIVHRVNVVFYC